MVVLTICICVIGFIAIGLGIYCICLLDDVKFYKDMYYDYMKKFLECKRNCENISEQNTEYEKIIENIKDSLPFN